MNEEHSSNQTETTKKSFFQSLIGRFFQGELKNREELVEVIRDSEQNDLIDQNTREMIEGVMEIAELRVRDIMIPRSQIVFIESNQDLDACLNTIIESAHSRFPVIADTDDRDNIEGILHAKDLLKFLREDAEEFELSKLLRPVVIVPESKRVDRMLKDFRSERFHMAIVVDEFGAVSGLVTIEDILEQIVGDIEDVSTVGTEIPHGESVVLEVVVERSFESNVVGHEILTANIKAHAFNLCAVDQTYAEFFGALLGEGRSAQAGNSDKEEKLFHLRNVELRE